MTATGQRFRVDDLQAVEPDALAAVDGITIEVDPGLDGMGFNRVAVTGPTREAVIEYARANWGDEDADWFREWVVDRVEELAPERDEQERAYEIASADVVLPLSSSDAEAIAEALELLAGVDEGENTSYSELVRLAGLVRANLEVRS